MRYDLVVIATPNRLHVPLGIAALEAGLPVVIDKPMAPSVAEAQKLIEASQRTGKLLTVFQNRRWDSDFRTVRSLLDADLDLLGTVTRFESRFERYRPTPRHDAWRELGGSDEAGGLLYDLGSHLIDQALILFGTPTKVYAEIERRRAGVQVDDDTFVALQFASGVRAHLWMSSVARIPGPRMRISGLRAPTKNGGWTPRRARCGTACGPAIPIGAGNHATNGGISRPILAGFTLMARLRCCPVAMSNSTSSCAMLCSWAVPHRLIPWK